MQAAKEDVQNVWMDLLLYTYENKKHMLPNMFRLYRRCVDEWEEEDHPRDKDGKFANQNGEASGGIPQKNYRDVTSSWLTNEIEFAKTEEMKEYSYNDFKYVVDGVHVKQNNSAREVEVAEIVSRKTGKCVQFVPEVNGSYAHVKTPDYMIDNDRWDLKELKNGTSTNLLRNIVHKKKGQAENFIFDVTESKLSLNDIIKQAEDIFEYYNTVHVDKVLLIKNDDILKIYKRK